MRAWGKLRTGERITGIVTRRAVRAEVVRGRPVTRAARACSVRVGERGEGERRLGVMTAGAVLAEVVRRHEVVVKITKGFDQVDAVDVLQVLSLGSHEGEELLLEAAGRDADAVLEELERLFGNQFQVEQPRTANQ